VPAAIASDSIGFFRQRLVRVRSHAAAAGLDALLVSHLPNVRYLTGFAGTAGSAIVTAERAILVVDFRYGTAARELDAARAGLIDVSIAERNPEDTVVSTLHSLRSGRIGIEAASMPVAQFNRLSHALAGGAPSPAEPVRPDPALVPTERIVERARIVKDETEIATLREAARRLSGVARNLRVLAAPGRTERDIAADIDAALRAAGFERPAFETIVASGPNSALPHARPTTRIVRPSEGVVLDFGGVYDGYCVDLTRTLCVGGSPSLRRIFAAVVQAHAAAVAAVRPGVLASGIDAAAREVFERHGLGPAFGHGTGHGLGLEVHEEPRVTRAGTAHPDSTIEPGMVFTIEPGAYVPGVGGVRIEDDVLVVDGGAELLTDVPIEL
jgi:Xaa-Pro aminopeptidase